jgi:flagellar hook-length control protein FliK
MDALTLAAPVAAAPQSASANAQSPDAAQDKTFDQLMASQTPAEPVANQPDATGSAATDTETDPSGANPADVNRDDAQQDSQRSNAREVTAAELANDAESADAGRVAAAAALLQWLAVAPAPVPTAQPGSAASIDDTRSPLGAAGSSDPKATDDPLLVGALDASLVLLPAGSADSQDKGADSGATQMQGLESSARPIVPTTSFGALLNATGQPAPLWAQGSQAPQLPGGPIESPVGTQEWAQELGTRLAVMTARGEQTGSLRMSPEHLGPLEVQIRVQDDKASVVFGAQHADTRAALQEALPRLRELFAASGLQLLDAGVSRDGARQAMPSRLMRNFGAGNNTDSAGVEISIAAAGLRHSGLLDTIA